MAGEVNSRLQALAAAVVESLAHCLLSHYGSILSFSQHCCYSIDERTPPLQRTCSLTKFAAGEQVRQILDREDVAAHGESEDNDCAATFICLALKLRNSMLFIKREFLRCLAIGRSSKNCPKTRM